MENYFYKDNSKIDGLVTIDSYLMGRDEKNFSNLYTDSYQTILDVSIILSINSSNIKSWTLKQWVRVVYSTQKKKQ